MKVIVSCLALLLCGVMFQRCSTAEQDIVGNDGAGYTEHAAPVEYVSITAKGGSRVTFMTHALWGNSCGSYSRAIVTRTDSAFAIQIIGKEQKNTVCLTVMTVFDAPVTVFLPSAGAYRFKFWRSDSTSIDTTFTVK